MNTLLDRNTREDQERELHNAMIAERYKEMLGVVEGQIDENKPVFNAAPAYAPVVETPTFTPTYNAPVMQQIPQVTEYAPTGIAASLFTTETLDRIAPRHTVDTFAPTYVAPQPIVEEEVVAVKEERYALSQAAKVAIAAFAAVVVTMLTLIGVNTQTIHNKNARLQNLAEKKQELIERNQEMQRYIAELQTEESIIQRATEAGLLD